MYGEMTDGELAVREAEDFVPPRGVFLLVLSASTTVAGGGVAPLVGDTAEVKRMWTSAQHRRRGLARRYRDEPLAAAFEKRLAQVAGEDAAAV